MARPEPRSPWEPLRRRALAEGLAAVAAPTLFLLLLLCSFGAAAQAPAEPPPIRIGIATMAPGEIFWERFGHNAIVVDDPARGVPLSYNFGFFDLTEPGFVGRFVQGDMQYMLAVLPFEQDLAYYRETGRGVSIQWLDLPPARARALAESLAINALPENARYSYDYFTDNCSTRVRDALDEALGGLLHERLASPATIDGNTWRSEAVRLASPAGWMWLGFDLGLGPRADVPLTAWQEAFVPMRLADSLRGVRLADGRPLVRAEKVLLPHRLTPEPAFAARPWWPWALGGMLVAVAIVGLGRWKPRVLAGLALSFWLLCGLLGALMLFLWCCTSHWSGWENRNLLVYGPLCLLAIPGAWRIARGRPPGRWFAPALAVIAVAACVALLLHLVVGAQDNLRWIGLLLPVHVAFWAAWRRARVPA
ncbi:MAG TPA: DUF4105 domain-containing protein [Xanthomonadaceae bacterium]|nr:DUF4105 domain-containing protein [Xanthomonadaceae bacterium]